MGVYSESGYLATFSGENMELVVILTEICYDLIEYKFCFIRIMETGEFCELISYVRGTAVYADRECVVVENHGIGYHIRTHGRTCEDIRSGQEVLLYTFLYVREDMLALYGFPSKEELNTFQILLGVNGIGPKAALSVLTTLSVEDLYYAVLSEDAKAIAKTPGIGPKGAKRMIVELKDKLNLEDLGIGTDSEEDTSVVETGDQDQIADVMEALVALGYSNGEAYRAVHKVKNAQNMDTEQLMKEALKAMLTI